MKKAVLVLAGNIGDVVARLNSISEEEFETIKKQAVEIKKGA